MRWRTGQREQDVSTASTSGTATPCRRTRLLTMGARSKAAAPAQCGAPGPASLITTLCRERARLAVTTT
jgi:hypothetical protein